MYISYAHLAGLLLVAPCALASITEASVVDLGYAKYQGVKDALLGTTNFYGLYYAAAPVGQRRWRAPIPIEHSNNYTDSVIDATAPGPRCYQSGPEWAVRTPIFASAVTAAANNISNEDCLLLDVIVPSAPVSTSLPVLISIHGGGYTLGSAATFPGNELVNHSEGAMISVQIQYRLGPQGFLASSAVREDGTGNAGLLDQREAIEWVSRNIHAFGGDASKITIWGGSAGGGSVIEQMTMYGGVDNPPFRAAIAEYPGMTPFRNNTILDNQYNELLFATNCTSLECLRGVSSEELDSAVMYSMAAGYNKGVYGYGDFYYTPAVDGHVLRDLPSNEMKRGHFAKVPLMTDRNGHEGFFFANFSITTDAQVQSSLTSLFPAAKDSFFTRLNQLYPVSNYGASYMTDNTFFSLPSFAQYAAMIPSLSNSSAFYKAADIWSDTIIICPLTNYISAVSDYMPTWKMNFFAGTELHGATAPFIASANNASGNATLSLIMKDYFASFVINLDPNGMSLGNFSKPYWPAFNLKTAGTQIGGQVPENMVMRVNQTNMAPEVDTDVSARCDFVSSQGFQIRN
ncbi:hypothetical protein AUEXF2481DRAFT_82451 [Aureobasidium subglaciale EXF-2481]|uniref:Carboxylic ester hydrolase n=1 Tax=Aureobasidium subglaciale (strain EXF-2481) TaxID=1043005 RepID=A0A074Y2Z2_AURSE|nr:uncharacterized protein AUEXF2481DRAFT_82451 [Aureobasidium subglaciale EXF-2481]KAI5200239.1 hypothetical protein E4T38_06603 [Aureobasidium subglaciale]KAI5213304.1 hypothetical protein E4T40_09841 [Aureobasidium subglaciale]KAI5214656.1 hypothetical protein E4T41_09837 [Aureobasidium subglaciale]KAI5252711.1 hypothetical protein E4T46_09829 [Aureobasidium subglaciale]KEQ92123.1 hypothetical protein AUEXF2481DRAFT_82451 [Aureobasidium subglaciale EXF-2481]